MKEALFYRKIGPSSTVKCELCAHRCKIREGKTGICKVRKNVGGILYSLVYGRPVSANVDPVEKKPLYHLMPGTASFSIATVGCNLNCLNCQNHQISHPSDRLIHEGIEKIPPDEIVESSRKSGCASISYTYTEPTVFFEYAFDISVRAHEYGIKNIFVTNGYMTPESIKYISPYLDAANIDLKSLRDEFYRRNCRGRLKPILDSIGLAVELGVWVEVTTLIIPGLNDSIEEIRRIAGFIYGVDPEIPWHISAFYPTYRMRDKMPTPTSVLERARGEGLDVGLKYVYTGNVPGNIGENTYCPDCKRTIIERTGYRIKRISIREGGCDYCGHPIKGRWG